MATPGDPSELQVMIRLMMWIEEREGRRLEVFTLADGFFPDEVEAELCVFSGAGGVAELPLWDGSVYPVWRDQVVAICGWVEGSPFLAMRRPGDQVYGHRSLGPSDVCRKTTCTTAITSM